MWIRAVVEAFRTWAEQTLREKPQKANFVWISTGGTLNYDRNDWERIQLCSSVLYWFQIDYVQVFYIDYIDYPLFFSTNGVTRCVWLQGYEAQLFGGMTPGVTPTGWSDGVGSQTLLRQQEVERLRSWRKFRGLWVFGAWWVILKLIWKAITGPSLLEKGKEWEGNDCNNGWTQRRKRKSQVIY